MKKYAEGGVLPQEMVDKMARKENEEDREMVAGPIRKLARRLKDNVMGTEEQNAKAEADEKRRARSNPEGNEAKFRRMMGKEFKAGGKVSKEVMEKAGFYDKDKSKQERQKIVNKVTTKPQRVAMVEKMFSSKNMKSGGAVKSASKRGDGCCIKGKTKGRMV